MKQRADLLVDAEVVLTMDAEERILLGGSVAVLADRIVAVGDRSSVHGDFDADRVIDAGDHLVMPGLVNTHTHLFGPFTRGLVNDLSFTPWIQKKFYLTSKGLNEETYYLSTLMGCLDMLKTGTTTFVDCGTCQGLEESAVRGVVEAGSRAMLSRTMADIQDDLAEFLDRPGMDTEQNLRETEAYVKEFDQSGDGRIRAWVCPIQVSSVSDDLALGAMEIAQKYDVGFAIHSNVDREDIANHHTLFGLRPIERFHKLGILNERFLGTHMGWLSDLEVQLLRDSGASAVHCPSASMKGGYGAISKGKFPELLQEEVTVGLGTDGPAASCYHDMFREVYLAATAHKEARLDHTLISPYQALKMATHGSAKAVLMADEIGSLEVGKKADLIALDLMRPEWVPWHEDNLISNLVYSSTGSSVDLVIVDGRIVVEDSCILTIDEQWLLREMQGKVAPFVQLSREWDQKFWPQARGRL
ncbi:MAG: amidohydrolase family protein [Actinobacteria bacterium]|nr:amidohydrolase family protein [Actinomycetota bacterium]